MVCTAVKEVFTLILLLLSTRSFCFPDIPSCAKYEGYKAMVVSLFSPLRIQFKSHILRFLERKWSQRSYSEYQKLT